MNRGELRGQIKLFKTNDDYTILFKTLKETIKKFGVVIHAYCLMTNHYHFLKNDLRK